LGSRLDADLRMPSTDEFTSFGNPELAVWSNRMQGRPGGDPHLVDRLRRGDPRAFEELVIAYQHRVFGVALRMLRNRSEAEEIAQVLDLPVNTVRSRLHRARLDLKAKLERFLP